MEHMLNGGWRRRTPLGLIFNRSFNYQKNGAGSGLPQAVQLAGTSTDFMITRDGFAPSPGTSRRSIFTSPHRPTTT